MTIAHGTKLGRYEIRSKIGEGGMGEVYLAEDTQLRRRVALKILPAEIAANQDRMRRFVQEAQAAAALNHPNIAHIYEIGSSPTVREGSDTSSTTEDETHFIAIEYVEGDTLREKIHRERAPLVKLLNYLAQVAEGLAKAHAAGIVHRDLKPDNIMITRDGYAKILDFGLAKLIEPTERPQGLSSELSTVMLQQHSTPGMILGTVGYMSPEQAQGRVSEIDHRSDIFSFGCILFEAATGRKAFEGKDPLDSLHKIVHMPSPQISEQNPAAPAELQRIVRRCLAKDPEKRYQSIKDVAIELEELQHELKSETELESSVAPARSSESTIDGGVQSGVDSSNRSGTTTTTLEGTRSSSSAEYIVSGIKRHKKGAVLILVALAVAVAILAVLYKFPAKKPAPFQSIKVTKLTNIGNATTAQISPNGEYVAHVFYEGGKNSVRIWDVATKGRIEIVPPTEDGLAVNTFSPDSRYIYFARFVSGQPNVLYQIAVLGGTPKKILEKFTSGVSFSPDGKQMVFVRSGPGQGENSLIIANADGTGERTLATRKSVERFGRFAPAWSPDGRTIASGIYIDGTNMTVAAVSVADGTVKPITSPKWLAVGRLAWLRDGTGLVFSADEDVTQIWYVSYPEGQVRRVTNDANEYGTGSVSITADASTIATIQAARVSNIFVAPAGDAAAAKRITGASSGLTRPAGISWTPDGKLVYSTIASGNADIWIAKIDGTDSRQLTNDPGIDTGPEVSPDGRYIVFQSTRSGRNNLWRMDLDGSNLRQLTNGGDDAIPNFSLDGKWVIYDSITTSQLQKVSIEGGDSVQLTNTTVRWPCVSPKDGMIAGLVSVGENLARLAIFSPEGGNPARTFEIPKGTLTNPQWTPDGRSILYVISRADASSLWSQSLDGGTPKQLADFSPEQIFSFDISRDGKWLGFARGTTIRDVILITDISKR